MFKDKILPDSRKRGYFCDYYLGNLSISNYLILSGMKFQMHYNTTHFGCKLHLSCNLHIACYTRFRVCQVICGGKNWKFIGKCLGNVINEESDYFILLNIICINLLNKVIINALNKIPAKPYDIFSTKWISLCATRALMRFERMRHPKMAITHKIYSAINFLNDKVLFI